MAETSISQLLQEWPEQLREAAKLVIDKYGDHDETTPTQLTWHQAGHGKRVVATKAYYDHNIPSPHIDAVETFLDYKVPPGKVSDPATFDGSVIVERTAGEVSPAVTTRRSRTWP